jgi:hypothetical protein
VQLAQMMMVKIIIIPSPSPRALRATGSDDDSDVDNLPSPRALHTTGTVGITSSLRPSGWPSTSARLLVNSTIRQTIEDTNITNLLEPKVGGVSSTCTRNKGWSS